jgi:transposase
MFRDEQRGSVWEQIRQHDLKAFEPVLSPEVLSRAAQRAGTELGRGVLDLATLAWLAVSAALRPGMNFGLVLTDTFRVLSEMGRLPRPKAKRRGGKRPGARRRSRHDPRRAADQPPSEEAFVQARARLLRVLPGYLVALVLVLGETFEQRHRDLLCWNGLRLLALDGTCVTLPRWKRLGEYFGYARNKRGTPRPQARMVMLLLAAVRMPWRYELTPRGQGESTVAARLLKEVGKDDLVLMDRGFFNFGLFRQIHEAGGFFAIRRIKRLRFRTLRRISPRERVVRWKPASSKWKGRTINLRVIDYQISGFRRSAIVTNLLDETRVSRAQFLGLSASGAWATERDAALYHRRWQIETAFREIKRVQKVQEPGGLRGRTREAIEYEVAGHVLLYLLVRWLMVEAAVTHGQDPLRLSFTSALHEVRHAASLLPLCLPQHRRRVVESMLRTIAGHIVPHRPDRHYPRPNDGKPRRTGAGYRVTSSRLQRCKA